MNMSELDIGGACEIKSEIFFSHETKIPQNTQILEI